MFLPEVAYYSTNNPNHVFFLSFLKECFHTISPKISFFTSTSPRCLIFAFDWLQASISSYFTALLPIRRLSFLSHMQVPFFLDKSFRKHSAIIFQYIFFFWSEHGYSIVKLLFQSVYIQRNPALRPPRLYDRLLPQLTSHSLSTQTWKSQSHFIILKTINGVPLYFFYFSFPHCRIENKTTVRQLHYGN